MTNIIEHTYTALANTGELRLTEKDYSTNYLGRCKSYYAYLKSTGKQPSTEVLLQLWAQLRLAEKQEKTKNKSKHYFFKKRQPNQFRLIPRLISGYPRIASSEAILKSQAVAIHAAPPKQ